MDHGRRLDHYRRVPSLKEILLASISRTRPLPLHYVLVNNLDMELSRVYYLMLRDKPDELVEIEFDRSALRVLLELL